MANTPSKTDLLATSLMRTVGAGVLFLGLAGCEAEFSISTARLSEGKMASAINPETKAPTAPASTFVSEAPAIYATAKLSNAPEGTKVKATFHYLESGERQIAEDEVQAGGSRYVAFTLSAPVTGWPAGQYETRFYLNGKEIQRQPFNIASASARPSPASPAPPPAVGAGAKRTPPSPAQPAAPPPAATAQAAAPQGEMKRFHDAKFGVELELPSSWTSRLTASKDYLFEGPKNTDAFELALVLQFVIKAANPGSSAAAQAQGLVDQLQRAPGGAIKVRETLEVAGQEALSFMATYTAADSHGATTTFAHNQIVLDHGAYYYLISYSGPAPIYQKHLTVFQHLVQTLRFIS